MPEKISTYACPNCGAIGAVGSICSYCGTMIPAITKPSRKKSSKKSVNSTKNDYNADIYAGFWRRLILDDFVPADIFQHLTITSVKEFWLPMHIIDSLPSNTDNAVKEIRGYVNSPDFLNDLPENYPESLKCDSIIIDFEYKDSPYYYIFINGFNNDENSLSAFPISEAAKNSIANEYEQKARSLRFEAQEYRHPKAIPIACLVITIISGFWCYVGESAIAGLIAFIAACCSIGSTQDYFSTAYSSENAYADKLMCRYNHNLNIADEWRNKEFTRLAKYTGIYSNKKTKDYWVFVKNNPTPFSNCKDLSL